MVKEKAVGEIERLICRRRAHIFLSGDTFVALRTVSLAYIITGICHVRGWLKKKKGKCFKRLNGIFQDQCELSSIKNTCSIILITTNLF